MRIILNLNVVFERKCDAYAGRLDIFLPLALQFDGGS